jgi:antitoxin MazE
MSMVKKLSVIGNSLGVIFDKPILELLGISKDSKLKISTDGTKIIIEPMSEEEHKKSVLDSHKKVMKHHDKTFRKLAK